MSEKKLVTIQAIILRYFPNILRTHCYKYNLNTVYDVRLKYILHFFIILKYIYNKIKANKNISPEFLRRRTQPNLPPQPLLKFLLSKLFPTRLLLVVVAAAAVHSCEHHI